VGANVDHRPRSNFAILLLIVPASLGAVSRKASRSQQGDPLVSLLLFEICIEEAVDLYPGKSRG
jgi:hypothetical protein